MKICIVDLNINFRYKRNVLMPIITHIATSLFGVPRAAAVSVAHVTRSYEKSSSEAIWQWFVSVNFYCVARNIP